MRARNQIIDRSPIASDNLASVLNHIKISHDGICTILTEKVDDKKQFFGRLGDIGDDYLQIKIVKNSFNWDSNNTIIALDEITKLSWGGEYHNTLISAIDLIQSDLQEEEDEQSEQPEDNEIIIDNRIFHDCISE
jgi:hypothetical protein